MNITYNKEDLYYKIFESCPQMALLANNDPIERAIHTAFTHLNKGEGWESVKQTFLSADKRYPGPNRSYTGSTCLEKSALEYLKSFFENPTPLEELPAPANRQKKTERSAINNANTTPAFEAFGKKEVVIGLIIGTIAISASIMAYKIMSAKTSKSTKNSIPRKIEEIRVPPLVTTPPKPISAFTRHMTQFQATLSGATKRH
ncbi:MAG: hypothetical protein K2Y01_00330 [Rhabdochlamydiaceae bacterium]|nr:hypothetical protein [Rhabdochlamydiaceae bacterium]